MATGGVLYAGGVLSAKDVELLSIAFDVSYTHLRAGRAPAHQGRAQTGRKRGGDHEVLKLCVAQGVQACNQGVPILAEELAARSAG